jgi:transcriptional regulator with XRE-family HTH domain
MTKAKTTRAAIASRLGEAMEGKGFRTRVSLSQAMGKAGYPITHEALGAYFRGDALPKSEILIGLRKVLNVSIDWLLTGEESGEPQDVKQLRALFNSLISKLGPMPEDLDTDLQKIMTILINLKPDQRAPLARLIEAYSKEHE